MATLAAWSERRILMAMRAWRQGCGALQPWFRATPFAAAHHYRDRDLTVGPAGRIPTGIHRLWRSLPRPDASTLWIFDMPAAPGLWLASALRRRQGLPAALGFKAWYDPRGILDGRREIPLLLALGERLGPARSDRGVCLFFDSDRRRDVPGGDPSVFLDNRYDLDEEDAPGIAEIRAAGWRRVCARSWGEPAKDLVAYLEYLEAELPVTSERDLGAGVALDG